MKISRLAVFLAIAALVLISGCAYQPPWPSKFLEAPGLWHGLLHGFLILFSLIGSLFTDVRIYAFPNAGFQYDLGFLIGAVLFLGGTGASGGRASRR